MYNFEQHLFKDEKILYEGRAVPGEGGKSISGLLMAVGAMLFIQLLLIIDIQYKKSQGIEVDYPITIIFMFTFLFEGLAIWGLIYNIFLKKKEVADDFYCITTKRAFKYEAKTNKLIFGYLEYYEDMKIYNEKDNFGDLYMGIAISEDDKISPQELKELMFNPNPENRPNITFESIENPKYVLELSRQARYEILNSIN